MIRTVDVKRVHVCRPPSWREYGHGSVWLCDNCGQRWIRNGGVLSFLNRGQRQGWGRYGEVMVRRWFLAVTVGGVVAVIAGVVLVAVTG